MEEPTHRTWMYARLLPRRKGYRKIFLEGVKEFIDFACRQPQYLNEGVIRCPCKVCKNEKDLVPSTVNTHIREEGFAPKYWYWTFHGEKVPHNKDDVEMNSMSKNTSELSAAITMLNMSQACFDDQPQLIQTQPQPQPESIQSHSLAQSQFHSTQPTQPPIQSQCHGTQPTQPQPQNQSEHIPTKVLHLEEYPMVNKAQTSSSSQVSEGNTGNKIMILPEGDGFDQHKLVVRTIASIIRTNLEEAKPSWKQLSLGQRNLWFNIFKSKFTWPPQYKDMVRRNFEKRGSAKMTQLMQDVRKNLNQKPTWMENDVWELLKEHWGSSNFKQKSEINKRNRESMDGASLHTGGSIPHRLHWKRMKEAKGTDPSLVEFYFRTHRKKKDQSWVGPHAESVYDKFLKKKFELSSMSSKVISGEEVADSQPTKDQMPSDFDVWVDSVGKKKGRIFGLGTVGNALFTSSSQPLKLSANSEEVDILRNQIQELNDSLRRQEQEKLNMRQELTQTKKQGSIGKTLLTSPSQPMKLSANSEEIDELRNQIKALKESLQIQQQEKLEMKQELIQTKKQVFALMQHLGFFGSSTVPSSSPQHSSINEDNGSDTVSDHIQ
ncbi:hypothetical protein LR48_Vigan404s002600 [Vigna angularis]|uniref:Transposase-associated domain-containing protein n=2 Tax=Phaseolus angularis TaxID=3914 RepID=A0A0L9T987_PHAAN|nr:uncharacterized protein LOC108320398 isoform X2 [Vigna angularis]XP_017407297.1 uncharacterized protein LOC108320398 isoform X2 [Vigna angularis]KAG2404626.1 uncharacterized protein HKW66_Vig0115480 [Vigna angularis]KOM27175.1 hypothetical protein LR48_Vigan404s002600 [Vigna angularis]